jgi:hypothetical protein
MFESINTICAEGSPNVSKIKDNVTTPDGLAIDWVHGLLFWTDTGIDTVKFKLQLFIFPFKNFRLMFTTSKTKNGLSSFRKNWMSQEQLL